VRLGARRPSAPAIIRFATAVCFSGLTRGLIADESGDERERKGVASCGEMGVGGGAWMP
jgi:hypothetical protein